MYEELKSYGLRRHSLTGVGKRMRDHLWVHVSYLPQVSRALMAHPLWSSVPQDALPVIARINLKNWNDLTLIECHDFDSSEEPVVGRSFALRPDQTLRIQSPPNNPLIYHHKWLFVTDDYPGFNVVASKKRSLSWKRIAGKDAYLSSRIGRQDFWLQWLTNAGLTS